MALSLLIKRFSSLSESGFIPTAATVVMMKPDSIVIVLISFREWLHSYRSGSPSLINNRLGGSHLFQRVASFLPATDKFLIYFDDGGVLISFREWLHSYTADWLVGPAAAAKEFSSLSESGFIPTDGPSNLSIPVVPTRSHLFQRVASFLRRCSKSQRPAGRTEFSSLSESGFIPTKKPVKK